MIDTKRRYYELDLARGLPLLGMPVVHLYEELLMHGIAADGVRSQGLILLYLCMFGPSVFMISLGMNLVFSSHCAPKDMARRGIRTVLLFYALNVVRYLIPGTIAFLCGDTEAKASVLRQMCCSDILFFAGISFLFFALLKKFLDKPFYILLVSILMLTLDMLIPNPYLESELLSIALGKFLYVNGWSCFPVLSYMVFPAVGYYVGHIYVTLKTEKERSEFWKNVFLGSVVGGVALGTCMYSYGLNPFVIAAGPMNDYLTNSFAVILDVFIAGIWYSCFYFLYTKLRETKLLLWASNFSRNILTFYCVHWFFVGWLEYMLLAAGLRNQHVIDFKSILIISTIIGVASIWVSGKLKKKRK